METNTKNKKVYDLVERTSIFAKRIVQFSKKLPKDATNLPLINQLVKAGTSIGANYCEADCAESRRDYIHKVGICKKEARETEYWLDIVATVVPKNLSKETQELQDEARELRLICVSLIKNSKVGHVSI